MESYDILVIGLSILLAVFLILSIFVIVKVMQLVKKVESITDKAQDAADNVQDITAKLSSAASFSALGTAAAKAINLFKKGK
jgi:CHASE3 domain sensor protein